MSNFLSASNDNLADEETVSIKKSIKALSQRSNTRGVFVILRDVLSISLIIIVNLTINNIALYAVSIWIIGAFQFAMSECLLHEAAHWNLFRWKKLNNWCEVVVGLPFFLTIQSFRAEHRLHHIYPLQERDRLTSEYEQYGLRRKRVNAFWVWFVKPLTGYSTVMFRNSILTKMSKTDILKLALFWISVLTLTYVFKLFNVLIEYWLVPLIFCKGSYLYWSEISDHYNTKSGHRTRPGKLLNAMFHNNGYHHAHHRYPSVPQFNLQQAHKLTMREGDDLSSGFFQTYLQIRTT